MNCDLLTDPEKQLFWMGFHFFESKPPSNKAVVFELIKKLMDLSPEFKHANPCRVADYLFDFIR